ncbi:MAG: glycosyltransferase [Candidatus Diapherotrites archaeon]
MNIAIFSDTFLPQINGVSVAIGTTARGLQRKGHKVVLFAPSPAKKIEVQGIEVVWLKSKGLPTYKEYRVVLPSRGKTVEAKLREFKAEIVLCETPFGAGWLGLKIARKLKLPAIGFYHTLLPDFLKYLPLPLLRGLGVMKSAAWAYSNSFYNKCDLIVTPSDAMKKELEAHGAKKEVMVLPNPIRREWFEAKKVKRDGRLFWFVFVGRVSYEKNLHEVIDAFEIAAKKLPSLRLKIIGDGPERKKLEKMAAEKGLGERIVFTGALREKELIEAVAACDAFVIASTIETQGMAVIEAMALGLPAVAADFLALKEIVIEGQTGLLFEAHKVEELAERMAELAESREIIGVLGANALKKAEEFSEERLLGKAEKALVSVSSGYGEKS